MNAKKLLSCILALVMVFAMAVCVSAADEGYTATLFFVAGGWYPTSQGEIHVPVAGPGEYSFVCKPESAANGLVMLYVDIPNAGSEPWKVSGVKLELDGKEVAVDLSKVQYGDLEGKGTYRIEVYNEYGATKNNSPVNMDDIKFSEEMVLTITLSDPNAPVDMTTVYAKAPDGWTEVNLYAWNDGGNAGDWPGIAMTRSTANEGWWEAQIPADMVNIIVNNGSDKPQTNNLTLDAGAWIVLGDDLGNNRVASMQYTSKADAEKPVEPVVRPEKYTIHVNIAATDWESVQLWGWGGELNDLCNDWGKGGIAMNDDGDGWYSLEITGEADGFLFRDPTGTKQTGNADGGTQNFDLSKAEAWYTISADKNYTVVWEDPNAPSKTADTAEIALASVVMILAVAGMGITLGSRKKF